MADVLAAGKQVLQELMGKLPEGDRAAVEGILAKPEAADAVKYLGDGLLRRQDHSARLNDLNAETARLTKSHADLTTWYEGNKKALELGAKAIEAGWTPSSPATDPATVLPADVVRKADLDKILDQREMGAARYFDVTERLRLQHMRQFDEILNVTDLLTDPRIPQLGVEGVYQAKYADQLKTRADAAEAKRIKDLVDKGMAEERRRFANAPVAPVAGQSPSPLDSLAPTTTDVAPGLVDKAVDEYQRLVASRTT